MLSEYFRTKLYLCAQLNQHNTRKEFCTHCLSVSLPPSLNNISQTLPPYHSASSCSTIQSHSPHQTPSDIYFSPSLFGFEEGNTNERHKDNVKTNKGGGKESTWSRTEDEGWGISAASNQRKVWIQSQAATKVDVSGRLWSFCLTVIQRVEEEKERTCSSACYAANTSNTMYNTSK